jgi:proteasome lid subunit RPN8/RPN11
MLRLTPTAWAKLLYLRDVGRTEIGGFGVAAEDDLLLVEGVELVRQTASVVHVEFDDEAVADYFDAQVDAGRRPQEFARIWVHTHPGSSPEPSQTDEETFARVFGQCDWAVMFVLARGGQAYARLRYNVGPGVDVLIPVEVDYSRPFEGSDWELWHEEYEAHVHVPPPKPLAIRAAQPVGYDRDMGQPPADWFDDWFEYLERDNTPKEADYVFDGDF